MITGDIGRSTLLGMPGWAIVLFYALAFFSLAICTAGFVLLWRKYMRGRNVLRTRPGIREFLRRILRATASLTVVKDDPVAGVAHATLNAPRMIWMAFE